MLQELDCAAQYDNRMSALNMMSGMAGPARARAPEAAVAAYAELIADCPALATARHFTRARLAAAGRGLASLRRALDAIETVAVGGSLGRLEAHPGSDVDCIVILRPGVAADRAGRAVERVLTRLDALDLAPAKAGGIYRSGIGRDALTAAHALGSLDEPAGVFGKRMQLLLDARPIFRRAALDALRRALVTWYGTGFLEADPRRSWSYLLNDLMRYLHAYAAWQQHKFERGPDDSWWLRQVKLGSTRIVTVAGLLVLLGESSARADKREWLAARLALTPMERLCLVMCRYDEPRFLRLLAACESVQAMMADPVARAGLIAGGPAGAAELATFGPAVAPGVDAVGRIGAVLTEFLLDRRRNWDPRFFERLIL
jgi:hypothetical protein